MRLSPHTQSAALASPTTEDSDLVCRVHLARFSQLVLVQLHLRSCVGRHGKDFLVVRHRPEHRRLTGGVFTHSSHQFPIMIQGPQPSCLSRDQYFLLLDSEEVLNPASRLTKGCPGSPAQPRALTRTPGGSLSTLRTSTAPANPLLTTHQLRQLPTPKGPCSSNNLSLLPPRMGSPGVYRRA